MGYKLNGGVEPHKITDADRKKSGETRKRKNAERRKLKEELEILLDKKIKDKKTGKNISTQEALCVKLIYTALNGQAKDATKAFEIIRDTIGQQPKTIVDASVNSIDQNALNEIDEILQGIKDGQ